MLILQYDASNQRDFSVDYFDYFEVASEREYYGTGMGSQTNLYLKIYYLFSSIPCYMTLKLLLNLSHALLLCSINILSPVICKI